MQRKEAQEEMEEGRRKEAKVRTLVRNMISEKTNVDCFMCIVSTQTWSDVICQDRPLFFPQTCDNDNDESA